MEKPRNHTYCVRFYIWHKQRVPLDIITARELEKNRECKVTHKRPYLPHFRAAVFILRVLINSMTRSPSVKRYRSVDSGLTRPKPSPNDVNSERIFLEGRHFEDGSGISRVRIHASCRGASRILNARSPFENISATIFI